MKKEYMAAIERYVISEFGDNSGGISHTIRVYNTAKRLSEEYDDDVLHAACFLHDINMDKPHPQKAALQAKEIMEKINFPKEKQQMVLHAIDEHGYYGNPDSKEAFMLFDADQLDSMGITGFSQFCGFDPDPGKISKVLESIEREGSSILRLTKSKSFAKEKIENRKKVIRMMKEEIGL
jgi:HD superfamily phosphodiesterase